MTAPRAAGGLTPKLLIWTSTALFLGFSLGIGAASIAAAQAPHCIEGQSLLAPPAAKD